MRKELRKPVPQLLSVVVVAGLAIAGWALWLGWRQQPYGAWQVAGLGVTLLVPVCSAALRRYYAGAVIGTTAGLTAAAYYDWSDDSSGLFVIGVGLVMICSLLVTGVLSAMVASATRGE
ncbi:hypothetical protein [Streptomyces sp. NPDC086787]|uniref:hypothetical protein n=1 Tax=Streptomyces sp. NPDC086787 TaxID=3365759 RepID=UPI003825747C